MIENAILLDSTVPTYALGEAHRLRDSNRALLSRLVAGEFRGYASVEMVQELVHHRLRRTGDRAEAVSNGRDIVSILTILNFDREILDLSLALVERHPTVRGRDAVHAATAMAYGIERIASTDRAFDDIPGITRVDPLTFQ